MKQLWDMMVLSGFAFVEEELEAERTALCAPDTHIRSNARRCAPDTCPVPWFWAAAG